MRRFSPSSAWVVLALATLLPLAPAPGALAADGAHGGLRAGHAARGGLIGGPGTVPRSFFGVMAADDPTAAEDARMRDGGIGTVRINLVWAWVQPDSSTEFDWDHYDQVIGDAARAGIRVLPTIYGSPSWAAVAENFPPWQGNVDAFRAFVAAGARRYGADGTFWAAHPEIPRLPVIWWQLWNEVSSSNFWDRTPKAAEYVDLLRVFREGVKEGDPTGRVLLAGLFPTPISPNGIPFKTYLKALYKRGAKPLFDGAAIHPYGSTPQVSVQRIRSMRRIMSRYGDGRKPIWVTEIGWGTGGLPSPLTVSPQLQATYLVDTYRELAATRRRLGVAGVIWFSFRDRDGWAWFDNSGLLTTGLQPKPSWTALLRLTGSRG